MLKAVMPLFKALRAGQELSAPGAWKVLQNWINLLSGLVALAWALGYPIPLMEADIALLAGAIIALVNMYLNTATTKKIGLPDHEKPSDEFERRSREHAERMAQRVTAVQQEYEKKEAPNPKNRVDFE